MVQRGWDIGSTFDGPLAQAQLDAPFHGHSTKDYLLTYIHTINIPVVSLDEECGAVYVTHTSTDKVKIVEKQAGAMSDHNVGLFRIEKNKG